MALGGPVAAIAAVGAGVAAYATLSSLIPNITPVAAAGGGGMTEPVNTAAATATTTQKAPSAFDQEYARVFHINNVVTLDGAVVAKNQVKQQQQTPGLGNPMR